MSGTPLDGVVERIATVREALGAPPPAPAVVPFEIAGQRYDLQTMAGLPQAVVERDEPADWALVVDDWSLIVPLGEARGLGTLRACGIRFGDELWPLPPVFEVDRLDSVEFTQVKNALLYTYLEQHGTPVGSVRFCMLYRDGVPSYVGDVPAPEPHMPKMAVGFAWPLYHEYRAGHVHQLALLDRAWMDGNWKDLLTCQGLYDAAGFAEIQAAYPELPRPLLDYCTVLSEAARMPSGDA